MVNFSCHCVLRGFPRHGIVRFDERPEFVADFSEKGVLADAVDRLGTVALGIDDVEVEIPQHVETPLAHSGKLREV